MPELLPSVKHTLAEAGEMLNEYGMIRSQADSMDKVPVQYVHFVLVNNFSLVAFGLAVDALRLANKIVQREVFRWRFYSIDGNPVHASNRLTITDVLPFNQIEEKGLVLICSGDGIEVEKLPSSFLSGINTLHRHGQTIIGICTGTYILAQAGMLTNRQCTIHWEYHDLMKEDFPDIEVLDQLYLFDKTICTCSGGTAFMRSR